MSKEKNSFLIYYDFEDQTSALSDQQVGKLVRLLLAYEKRGEIPEGGEPSVQMAFLFLKPGLDSNREKYVKMCERNRRNRSASSPVVTSETSGTDTEPDSEPEPEMRRKETLKNDFYTDQSLWQRGGTRGW